MKERERTLMTSLTILMIVVWAGFLFHRSPRFAGSFWGGVLGVSGAGLMLLPLVYMVVKRVPGLRKRISKIVSMRTLLTIHLYGGVLGPVLIMLHTGHKFESVLGVVLTACTLVVVISGFVGRYLMQAFSSELREKKSELAALEDHYQRVQQERLRAPGPVQSLGPYTGFLRRALAGVFLRQAPLDLTSSLSWQDPAALLRLTESMADLEYAIKTHETFKRWFARWLKFHIVISLSLYALLTLHVAAAVHFGLRWFETPTSLGSVATMSMGDETTKVLRPVARNFPLRAARRQPGPSPAGADSKPADTPGLTALERFTKYYSALYRTHWRPAAVVHGVRTTVFDYAAMAREVGDRASNLEAAVRALRQVTVSALRGDDDEKAFWINVYNFTAMKMVVDSYPVGSITDPKVGGRRSVGQKVHRRRWPNVGLA